MRKLFLLLPSLLVFLIACHTTNTKIKEHISGADSVAINYFKGDGSMDTVAAVKIISDKKIIEQLVNLIAVSTMSDINKCGYDGSLHFFKQNKVIQDIDFRMNDMNCMQFSFLQDGQLVATALTPEAKQLLESVRK